MALFSLRAYIYWKLNKKPNQPINQQKTQAKQNKNPRKTNQKPHT